MESSAAPQPMTESADKVRILLQTFTHLVPGNDRREKLKFTKNVVCQHLWNRNFDRKQERWYPYHDYFALDKVQCFFMIDHHGHDHTVHEETVAVLWYKWTGESLVRIHETLPGKIQRKLKKCPFTWDLWKLKGLAKGPDGQYDPIDRRMIVRSDLRQGADILEEDLGFLREYPEHAQWLKANLEPHLWVKLEAVL